MANYLVNNEKFHIFSKSPVLSSMAVSQAVNKSGHTVSTNDVWADDVPWFTEVADEAGAITRAADARYNDLILWGSDIYVRKGDKTNGASTGTTFAELWEKHTDLTEARAYALGSVTTQTPTNIVTKTVEIKNASDKVVLKYHVGKQIDLLTTANNANVASTWAARMFIDGKVVDQFVSPTDKVFAGNPSTGYTTLVYTATAAGNKYGFVAEGEADADFVNNAFAGIVQFNQSRNSGHKFAASVFEYVGDKLDTSISGLRQSIKDISDVTLKGVVASVTADEQTAQKAGITVDNTVSTTPIIKFTGGSVTSGETKLVTGGTVASAIDTAVKITGIQVKVGSGTAQTLTPSNKVVTIEIPEVQAAVVSGGVITTDGFVKASDAKAIAEKAISTSLAATTTEGSIGKAIADVEGIINGVSQTVSGIQTDLASGATAQAIADAQSDATQALSDAAAAMTEAGKKVASVTGPTTGLVTVTGDKAVTITVSDQIATKTDAATAASTAITTSLNGTTAGTIGAAVADAKKAGTDAASALNTAKSQSLAQTGTLSGMFTVQTAGTVGTGITGITISDAGLSAAIAKAKTDAETTAATNLATARGEITTEIGTAVSGLETKLTAGEGSLGGRVTALETATGTTLPAAIEQALTDAKAYSDSLHTTSLDYVVLGDSESLPTASADTLGKIYLVASQNAPTADGAAISGSYVEYMTRKVSDTQYTWEKIGTTAADLSAYAKTADLNATNVGSGAVKVSQTNGKVSSVTVATEALVADGAIKASVTDANALVKAGDALAAIKLAKPENYVASVTGYTAEGSQVTTTQGAAVKVLDGRGTSVTDKDLWGTTATMDANGVVNIAHNWVTNPNASKHIAWNSSITKVEDNKAYVGDTMWANVQTERIKDGRNMFYYCGNLASFSSDLSSLTSGGNMFLCAKLTSFSSDLSSLMSGFYMFMSCTNLASFTSDLPSLTNGESMFWGCSLTSFTSDLSSLTNGKEMFGSCTKLTSFTSELPSLTNGESMFAYCNTLNSFKSNLSSLTDGSGMFYTCTALNAFSSELPSLTDGVWMFRNCYELKTFSSDLSNLTSGNSMFMYCTSLESFSSDLSSLTNGESMFNYCTNLASFSTDLSSLTDGTYMFYHCDKLTSFTSDLSSLTNGKGMFHQCSNLTSFTSDLSSLTDGSGMFMYCKLDTESVEIIADTINTVNNGRIDIMIGNTTPNDEEDAAFKQMQDKGWDVYVNGSGTEYVPRTGEASLDETGETTVAPKPYWAKPIEVTEDKAEYVGQDGKFYQVVGGQFIYVNDPDTYGMFVSLEDAVANMRLTKYEKPVEEETEAQA